MYAHWKVWLLMLGWHLLLYNRFKYDRNVSVTPTPTHHQSLSRLETEVCVVNLEYIKRNSLNSRYVDSELCSVQCESCFAVFYDHINMCHSGHQGWDTGPQHPVSRSHAYNQLRLLTARKYVPTFFSGIVQITFSLWDMGKILYGHFIY